MNKCEKAIVTVLCMVYDCDCYSEFIYERSKSDNDWLIRLY